jgi:hypothetical protein
MILVWELRMLDSTRSRNLSGTLIQFIWAFHSLILNELHSALFRALRPAQVDSLGFNDIANESAVGLVLPTFLAGLLFSP